MERNSTACLMCFLVSHFVSAVPLIEKTSMTDIAHQLSISTSTVIRKLKEFKFKTDLSYLPTHMSWDEYAFTKGKMSFIEKLNIITVLEGRTQAVIRDHFLKYDRAVRCLVKIITMDMFSPYDDLARQLRFLISRLRLFHSLMPKLYLIAFTLRYSISKLKLKQSSGLFYSNT